MLRGFNQRGFRLFSDLAALCQTRNWLVAIESFIDKWTKWCRKK